MKKSLYKKTMKDLEKTELLSALTLNELQKTTGGGLIDTIKQWFGIDSGVKFGGGSTGGGGSSGSW